MPDNTGNQSISVKSKWPVTNSIFSFLFLFVIGYQSLILSLLFSLIIYSVILWFLLLIFPCHWDHFTLFPSLTWEFLPSFLLFPYFEILAHFQFLLLYSLLIFSFALVYLLPFPLSFYLLLIITFLMYAQKISFYTPDWQECIYIYIDMGINAFSAQEIGPVGMSNGTLKHF